MDILEIISRRMSVRNYQPEPVETAEIQELLNAGERDREGGDLDSCRIAVVCPLE
jgi:nitroreductase